MNNTKIFDMPFASVYPLYIRKVEKKGRTKAEVDAVIFWLTGIMTKHCDSRSTGRVILEPFLLKHPKLILMLQKSPV
jgi:hypothetical protein